MSANRFASAETFPAGLPRPVFVVSPGRSGSLMMAHVLRIHPSIAAFHELFPGLHTEGFASWNGRHSQAQIDRRVLKKRERLIRQVSENGYIYVESAHYHSLLIPSHDSLFGARFIHIARNGRDFVRSGLRRSWYVNDNLSPKRWMRRNLWWSLGQPGEDHRLAPPSCYKSRVARIAWLWVEYNKIIRQTLETVDPDRAFFMRVEDMCEDVAAKLLAFVRAPPVSPEVLARMVAVAGSRPNRSRKAPEEAWSRADEREFIKIAGDMMATLGYSVT